MSESTLGVVGVIDSEDYFWQRDERSQWVRLGAPGVGYPNLKELEAARGQVTPLYARPPGKSGEPTAFEEHAAALAESRRVELEKAQARILQLETLCGVKIEGHACECTEITPGNHISPPEYEQNPWCPVHPSISQIREELTEAFGDRIELRNMIINMAQMTNDRPLTPGEIEVVNLLNGHPDREWDALRSETARQKDLLEKATDLIEAQRIAWEAEQTYVNLHRDAMDKRRAYEKAKEASER